MAGLIVEYAERVLQDQTCIEQRQQCMRQCLIGLDDVTHGRIEGPVAEFWWQLDTKDLKQAADLILEIDALA